MTTQEKQQLIEEMKNFKNKKRTQPLANNDFPKLKSFKYRTQTELRYKNLAV